MTTPVRAIYENGLLRLLDPAGTEVGETFTVQIVKDDTSPAQKKPRIAGLHAGMWTVSDDFDDELPDSFWLGEDE